MAEIERLVQTNSLKTAELIKAISRHQRPYLVYDPESDELLLQFVSLENATIVHYVDEHMAFLYDPNSNEIVGFQVEAFQKSFLPKHESIRHVWRLSDTGIQLENMEELVVVFERTKQAIAREIVDYAEPWLQEVPPWGNAKQNRVPA
jgi:hypothetical protein